MLFLEQSDSQNHQLYSDCEMADKSDLEINVENDHQPLMR